MFDPLPVLKDHLSELRPYRRVGLVATAQHLNRLPEVKDFLESHGKEVEVGGQILGCRQDNALRLGADCYLYIGSGRFHPLGVSFKTDKPVFILNPFSQALDKITDDEKRRWLGKRKGAISRALNSDVFGIMVSLKSGQFNLKKALKLKETLEGKGREAFIFAAQELTPNNLLPFKVDCWVNTACPRIEGDEYNRPVVNAEDLEGFLIHL